MAGTMICNYCNFDMPPKAVRCPECDTTLSDSEGNALGRKDGYSFYGVGRGIPDSIKSQVRKECGYGCVIDGKMIVEYDHFKPEFTLLKGAHRPEGIALLCRDCHGRKAGSQPQLTNEMVENYRAKPYAVQRGQATYPMFFFPPGPKYFRIGELLIEAADLIFKTDNGIWLSITQPIEPTEPVLVNAHFKTQDDQILVDLSNNILKTSVRSDVDFTETASSIKFTQNGHSFLELDRSMADTMNIINAHSWFDGRFIEVKNSALYINGGIKIGGGNLTIRCGGSATISLEA